jgi:hypothetical protein
MVALSRRDFLKYGLLATASLAFDWPRVTSNNLGRVTAPYLDVRLRPTPESRRLAWLRQDDIVTIERTILGPDSRQWHDTGCGYVSTAEIQPVEHRINNVLTEIPSGGIIGEVTVPFTDARRLPEPTSPRLYRLYYSSIYWIRAVAVVSGGEPYYQLFDERLGISYFARAADLRTIPESEYAPLNPRVTEKQLVVNLATQTLTAWEGAAQEFQALISAGRLYKPSDNASARSWTPTGQFQVERKRPSRHMGMGEAAGSAYELFGVPWVSYFHWQGFAFHGTWWHNDFGRPRSAGCINMRPSDARWVYRWSLPFPEPGKELTVASGTFVKIIED